MKLAFQALFFLLLGITYCSAQESEPAADKENNKTGFEWLKQFEGTWAIISKTPEASEQPSTTTKGHMKSRFLGKQWIVNEMNGQTGAMEFEALQTIGYDTAQKQFTSTWVDSLTSYTWNSTGSLDATGKTLTLNAEGPDWSDPNKKKQYRDIYEFKSATEIASASQMMGDDGDWETFATGTMTKVNEPKTRTTVTPFLLFEGRAEEAINFYKTVFPDTRVESMTKYKSGETGKEGSVKLATVVIAGQAIKCIDSHIKHDFGFTPAFSFFVECESEAQLKQRFDQLAEGGKVMMPIDNYGFSRQFGWASDQFGISWQLNLK